MADIDMGPVISAVQSYGDQREAAGETAGAASRQAEVDTLNAQITDLQAQIAVLEGNQPDPTPTPTPTQTLVVGARAKDTTFDVMDSTIGPVRASRWFSGGSNATLPAKFTRSYSGTAIGPDADVWASFQTYTEADLRSYVASADPGTKMVLCHEPEDGKFPNGAAYVKWFDTARAIIKDVNPDMPCVHAAASYEYRSNGGVGLDGSWIPPNADIYTQDSYQPLAGDLDPLEQDDRFQNWLKLLPAGAPIGLTEYGRGTTESTVTPAQRAQLIGTDAEYLRSGRTGHPVVVWMYWWTTGTATKHWRFTDQASIDAWKAQAAK